MRQLSPKIDFRFHAIDLDRARVVLLVLSRAVRHPVQFAGVEYIRIGSYKKKLKDFQERERQLWRILDAVPFELLPAAQRLSADVNKLRDDAVLDGYLMNAARAPTSAR